MRDHLGESRGRSWGPPRYRLGTKFQTSTIGCARLKKHLCLPMTDEEEQALRAKLAQLRQEHGDLDAAIAAVAGSAHCDQLQLTRLKKRKLQLKDHTTGIKASLLRDITA